MVTKVALLEATNSILLSTVPPVAKLVSIAVILFELSSILSCNPASVLARFVCKFPTAVTPALATVSIFSKIKPPEVKLVSTAVTRASLSLISAFTSIFAGVSVIKKLVASMFLLATILVASFVIPARMLSCSLICCCWIAIISAPLSSNFFSKLTSSSKLTGSSFRAIRAKKASSTVVPPTCNSLAVTGVDTTGVGLAVLTLIGGLLLTG